MFAPTQNICICPTTPKVLCKSRCIMWMLQATALLMPLHKILDTTNSWAGQNATQAKTKMIITLYFWIPIFGDFVSHVKY